jgi:hypothetical protein
VSSIVLGVTLYRPSLTVDMDADVKGDGGRGNDNTSRRETSRR